MYQRMYAVFTIDTRHASANARSSPGPYRMNQALVDPPGTQTYIKELGEGKVEPNPNKVTSFPFFLTPVHSYSRILCALISV